MRGEAGGRCEKTEEDLEQPIAAPAAAPLTFQATVVNPDAPLASVHALRCWTCCPSVTVRACASWVGFLSFETPRDHQLRDFPSPIV
ncbi:MAG: hypothetical protein ACPIOQ_85365 [Promethearchaeia archaeon]